MQRHKMANIKSRFNDVNRLPRDDSKDVETFKDVTRHSSLSREDRGDEEMVQGHLKI